jgi:threonine 3-dehydrogenase
MAKKLGAHHVLVPANTDGNVYEHDPELAKKIRSLTDGVGVDVALEMSGQNASVNNAIASVRRGGDVILFGLKSGDAVIEDLDRVIVDGISLHSVVGRRIFETWHITKNLLESREPNIHDLIYDVILNGGKGTVVDFKRFEKGPFEQRIQEFPKVLLSFAGGA